MNRRGPLHGAVRAMVAMAASSSVALGCGGDDGAGRSTEAQMSVADEVSTPRPESTPFATAPGTIGDDVTATDDTVPPTVPVAVTSAAAPKRSESPSATPAGEGADVLATDTVGGPFAVAVIELDDGSTRWAIERSDELFGTFPPVPVGSTVVVTSGCGIGTAAGLDAMTGAEVWHSDPDLLVREPMQRQPSLVDQGVYVANAGFPGDVVLIGFDTETGHTKWTARRPDQGTMIAESASVVVGWSSTPGTVWVVDRRTGSELWSVPTGQPPSPGPEDFVIPTAAADAERVYLRLGDVLTAFDATGGEMLWSVSVSSPEGPGDVVVERGALLTNTDSGIVAFDVADGAESWHLSDLGVTSWLNETLVADGNLYVTALTSPFTTEPGSESIGSSTLMAVDVATGQPRWQIPADGQAWARAAGSGRVLFADGNGILHLADAADGSELWGPELERFDSGGQYTLGADGLYVGWRCGGD